VFFDETTTDFGEGAQEWDLFSRYFSGFLHTHLHGELNCFGVFADSILRGFLPRRTFIPQYQPSRRQVGRRSKVSAQLCSDDLLLGRAPCLHGYRVAHPVADTARPLLSHVVSSDGVEPHRRLDMWRSYFASLGDVTPLADTETDYSGSKEIWSLGGLALMCNCLPAMSFAREERHIRRDFIDHWMLRIGHSGQSHIRSGTRCFVTKPGLPTLLSLGEAFTSQRAEARWTTLYISRDGFPALSAGLAALGPGVLETPGAELLGDYLLLLERRLPELTVADVPMLVEATRSMIASCLLAGVTRQAESARYADVAARERIRRVVRRNIGSSTFSPEKLCKLAGVSRSRLYRLMEPNGGVARYIQSTRLRMAHAMLSDAERSVSIARIGERLGFFDPSAFTRVFRREFGYTPGEARVAAACGLLASVGGSSDVGRIGSDLGGFLRSLGAGTEAPQDDFDRDASL
jgi:AraC-like DNA-binding protein